MIRSDSEHSDHSFHVHYTQMQRQSMESMSSLYSLSSGSLPSHFRSVSPKPEVHFTIERDGDKPPSKCSTRTVYFILAAIFIISSSIAVAVVVHEIHRIQEESVELPKHQFINHTDTIEETTQDEPSTTARNIVTPPSYPVSTEIRTHCTKRCTVYGKPKFESSCVGGFCVCKGSDYQEDTCLPSISGCDISKDIHSKFASIWNTSTTAFRCTSHVTNETADDIYVISIIGNHFAESTVINVWSEKDANKPLTLVLASHYPVRWKLKHKDLQITQIVLVSDRKLSESQLEVINQNPLSSATPPSVGRQYLPVGYGDDRYHSNTSEMLKNINNVIGPVKTFLGASYADTINLQIIP